MLKEWTRGFARYDVECCPRSYEESFDLAERIDDRPGSAVCAFNLGHVFMNIAAIRDLAKAENDLFQSK